MESYRSFVAIVFATATEASAVMRMEDWKECRYDGDSQQYFETTIERDGEKQLVVAAQSGEMGMTAAAVLCMKLIERYRPRYLIMPGIAAGVVLPDLENQLFGDVVLASTVWNYSSGKFVSPELATIRFGNVGFIPRPSFIHIKDWLLPYIKEAAASRENETHVFIGPLASGSAVVANEEFLEKQIRHSFRDTAGLDMEAYAVVYAAEHAIEPKPVPIIAKSVCDYGDSRKNDQYQKFAAFTSCQFVKLLYEKYLPTTIPEEFQHGSV